MLLAKLLINEDRLRTSCATAEEGAGLRINLQCWRSAQHITAAIVLRSVLTALRAVLGLKNAAFGEGLAAFFNHIGLAANVT